MNNNIDTSDIGFLLLAKFQKDKVLEEIITANIKEKENAAIMIEPSKQIQPVTDEQEYSADNNFLLSFLIDLAIVCGFFYSIFYFVYNIIKGQATEFYFLWLISIPIHGLISYATINIFIEKFKQENNELK